MKVKKISAIIIAVCMAVSVTLTACGGSSVEVGEIISFGEYDWRVLDVKDGKALIITESVIEKREYHLEWEDITWEDSDIRQYLNDEFYNTFSNKDKSRIAETQVVNDDNPWFDAEGGAETTDKVFLLSLDEVVKYFGDSGQLANRPDDDTYYFEDEYNDSRMAYDKNGEGSQWWLRSPGIYSWYAGRVDEDGWVDVIGEWVDDDNSGVRPALWLTL